MGRSSLNDASAEHEPATERNHAAERTRSSPNYQARREAYHWPLTETPDKVRRELLKQSCTNVIRSKVEPMNGVARAGSGSAPNLSRHPRTLHISVYSAGDAVP